MMARWSDLATWRGSSPNRTESGMNRYDGQVTHIAAGYFEGTIAWQRNDASNVSSHFVAGRDWGQCAQLVDLDDAAWTQGDGNGEWISVENVGFPLGHRLWKPGWEKLSPWQIECNAQLFARGHKRFGWPLQLTNHPTRKGLGYHGMGAENGYRWGHLHCPGEPIKAQLPLILARAKEITGGQRSKGVPDMFLLKVVNNDAIYYSNGINTRPMAAGLWDNTGAKLVAAGVPLLPYKDLAELFRAGGPLLSDAKPLPITDEQLAVLTEKLAVATEAAAERAVRKVLGAVDGATPQA